MDCGFEQLTYELPDRQLVEELIEQAGYGAEMLERLHNGGLRRVPVSGSIPLSRLVNSVASQFSSEVHEFQSRTVGVIVAHSIPALAPDDHSFLAECLDGLGLEQTPRIAVSGQPCAILHSAVQLACAWVRRERQRFGVLVIGADKAYHASERIFFGSAMGDSVFAGFISHRARGHTILSSVTNTEIIATDGELSPPEDIAAFRAKNPAYIRHAIQLCLQQARVGLDTLAYIVPHTPYTMVWDAVSELLTFPRDRILTDYLPDTGHLNSNDSFVHYARAASEGRIRTGQLALLVNPAFGGTRGCTLIRR
ncbi:MAG: hypothetical protein HN976_28510 [Lentisphaerae bacterium]|jgi:3-oxoacyl-[acyl-carrier-protein] synthase III|nr:hypothetical protein [Lentisphaerota bacterium]MBT7059072.1 hypothetical protein [Lentisphaerota bacterium]